MRVSLFNVVFPPSTAHTHTHTHTQPCPYPLPRRYFHRHSAAIRRMFRFNAALEGSARRFIARARERLGHANDTMTVAVHVRRGDLYKFKAMTVPNDFWRRGIERLQHKFPGVPPPPPPCAPPPPPLLCVKRSTAKDPKHRNERQSLGSGTCLREPMLLSF